MRRPDAYDAEVAQRHHLVPEFYLRRFSDEDGRVKVINLKTGAIVVTSPKNCAVDVGFHSIETKDPANSERAEFHIGQIETRSAQARPEYAQSRARLRGF